MNTRIITSSFFILAVATAILILATPFGPSTQGDDGGAGINAFARRVAGTYLVDIPGRSEKYLFAFSADGNLLSEDTNDFGNGVPAASQSAFYGTWRQTGRRELVYTVLNFGFDPGGVNISTVRHSATVLFDKKFQNLQEEGIGTVFLAVQDPLDPDEVPIATIPFTGTGRRIPAVIE